MSVFRQQYRELNAYEKAQVNEIKDVADVLYELFSQLNSSRESSLAKTKLEEAVMWAVKHITT